MEKLYCYYEGTFCYKFAENLHVVVLEEYSLVLRFSKTFLVDLKISSELMECFAFILILHALSCKYLAERFGDFFTLKFSSNSGTNFFTF